LPTEPGGPGGLNISTRSTPSWQPIIHRALRKDGHILVHASDEIMVAGVKVTVRDAQEKLLEVGDGVQQEKDWWEYTPQAEGMVSVSAWDLPGNQVHMELDE
jgi:hypothetical protein